MGHWIGNGNACRCGPGGHQPGTSGRRKIREKFARLHGRPIAQPTLLVRGRSAEWKYQMRLEPCHYCGQAGGTIDHKLARSLGGSSLINNCVPACAPCNNWKGYLETCHGMTYAEFKAVGWKMRPFI
jgi:hypothetical protein